MLSFLAGIIVGAGVLFSYWMTRPEPKAAQHAFSATTFGPDDGAGYFKAVFKNLESGRD